MRSPRRAISLRDSTLREGLDVPGVRFSDRQALAIARMLASCGIAEAEIVAPARVAEGLMFAARVKAEGIALRCTGLVYGYGPRAFADIDASVGVLDEVDLLMPLTSRREPATRRAKIAAITRAVRHASVSASTCVVGAGFPHATQVPALFLYEIAAAAADAGATRLVVYDTNGSADPFSARDLIAGLTARLSLPVRFHGHNDLGLATANALAAVEGGARGLDVTANGLGDRAGNTSLEQAVMLLELRGWSTGVDTTRLGPLSDLVARSSGIPVPKLAPVVGAFAFAHRSPRHLNAPAEFEAFTPSRVGGVRRLDRTARTIGPTRRAGSR